MTFGSISEIQRYHVAQQHFSVTPGAADYGLIAHLFDGVAVELFPCLFVMLAVPYSLPLLLRAKPVTEDRFMGWGVRYRVLDKAVSPCYNASTEIGEATKP